MKNIKYISLLAIAIAFTACNDEDDFQDMSVDKYVDLKKCVPMECIYKHKFRRWVPLTKVEGRPSIVHIRQL